ncbi:unnamed protein product [[Actinomadura] parvosata subsp. kistnae]|uniref:Uncharacterized protein n=1 Tax=[Actinomadura] parvosata subsp. kistnae TaxID=1909395 RepID=A0A1V0A1U4_9ACTN|nr:hypothetical protein [Nonomuraea sp. ATCC 55076]AQZ64168.1 hypothetical protein BKM31_24280 [Nonomuraea sp. ATCC 55076]SPL87346.1 unnamed protein product [Actinomadura parvosata subsp. kistnae]
MTEHAISPQTGILGDTFACGCGVILGGRMSAELHAAENGLCSACLGSTEEEVAPGLNRPCTSCAGSGRRREQVNWQLAHAEAEHLITMTVVRGVVAGFDGPFRLSEVADTVRNGLGLPAGRLPVGPRVRDLLLQLQAAGEITMLSAPDEMVGTDMVLYRDPQWQRARTLGL